MRVTTSSSQWETRMSESIRCWESFKECEAEVAEWLQTAEQYYQEKEITTRGNLEKHKVVTILWLWGGGMPSYTLVTAWSICS